MSKETSLFGKWLVEAKGIDLEDYANAPRERKNALQDEYDREDWRRKSEEAAKLAAAATPANFYEWLEIEHRLTRAEFEKLTPQHRARLWDTHQFERSRVEEAEKTARTPPLQLPPELKDASPSEQLRWINKQDMIAKGYVRE